MAHRECMREIADMLRRESEARRGSVVADAAELFAYKIRDEAQLAERCPADLEDERRNMCEYARRRLTSRLEWLNEPQLHATPVKMLKEFVRREIEDCFNRIASGDHMRMADSLSTKGSE